MVDFDLDRSPHLCFLHHQPKWTTKFVTVAVQIHYVKYQASVNLGDLNLKVRDHVC